MPSPFRLCTAVVAAGAAGCLHAGASTPRPSPHLELSAPTQVTGRVGAALVPLTLRNAGPGLLALDVDASLIHVDATAANGKVITCHPALPAPDPARAAPPLDVGAARHVEVDLAARCAFHAPGRFRVSLRYAAAPDQVALGAWSGTGGPVEVSLVLERRAPWKNPGPLSPGQGPQAPPPVRGRQ